VTDNKKEVAEAPDLPEAAKALLAFVVPGDNPTYIRFWRGMVAVIMLGFLAHVMWACGYFEGVGLHGFLRSADITGLIAKVDGVVTTVNGHGAQLNDIRVSSLESAMLEMRKEECTAHNKDYFTRNLQRMATEHWNLTQRADFTLPQCSDLKN
jgi:hypothetical protein